MRDRTKTILPYYSYFGIFSSKLREIFEARRVQKFEDFN